ncbi:hypothetical protein QWZ14_11310, partial [Paeniroseomonas aquatica]|nr:hypothetical protein [Paeniroseomonas aquatica]
LALLAAPALARAEAPGGSVTLLVGAAAGGGPDLWARGFAPFLERHWPRAAIAVLNRPGEGGLAAARSLAAALAGANVIASVATPQLLARAVEAAAVPLLERLAFIAAVAEEPLLLVGPAGADAGLAALRA